MIENVKAIREFAGDRAVLRAFHFFEENKRVDAEVEALEKKDFATFFNKITESGDSSWKWLQNCYCNETPDEQSITVALALTKLYLDKIGRGVCRVHGADLPVLSPHSFQKKKPKDLQNISTKRWERDPHMLCTSVRREL